MEFQTPNIQTYMVQAVQNIYDTYKHSKYHVSFNQPHTNLDCDVLNSIPKINVERWLENWNIINNTDNSVDLTKYAINHLW